MVYDPKIVRVGRRRAELEQLRALLQAIHGVSRSRSAEAVGAAMYRSLRACLGEGADGRDVRCQRLAPTD